jgi:hypothetical protein
MAGFFAKKSMSRSQRRNLAPRSIYIAPAPFSIITGVWMKPLAIATI